MPVRTCVAECAWNGGYICHWGHPFFFFFFEDVPLVEFIHLVFYSHARWSYRRRFRSLLLCPLSVEHYYFRQNDQSLPLASALLTLLQFSWRKFQSLGIQHVEITPTTAIKRSRFNGESIFIEIWFDEYLPFSKHILSKKASSSPIGKRYQKQNLNSKILFQNAPLNLFSI